MPKNTFDELIEFLRAELKQKRQIMKANLPLIRSEITAIISERDTDIKRIEHLLDTLLDYGQIGVGEAEFRRLNRYYTSFNAEDAKLYADDYNGMLKD